MSIIEYWEALKTILVPNGAAERSLVHVHVGMTLYTIMLLCSRRHFLTMVSPMAVTLLAVAGELADLSLRWPRIPAWLWWDSGTDIAHTIVWPWLIWAVAGRIAGRAAEARADQSSGVAGEDAAEDAGASGPATGR